MTPKEKAEELRDRMYLKIPAVYDPTGLPHYPIAKEMALIAVDEIIKSTFSKKWYEKNKIIPADYLLTEYWERVKQEIEKL